MIIVTGTKRSGTSMWMQILKGAGVQLIGEAFPKNWEESIGPANPHGFYESPFRRGVFFATNPDPRTGVYLAPERTQSVAVKVFIPGLCRTDQSYIGRVIGTMRHWREYAASLERLREMEEESAEAKGGREHGPLVYLDPVLEWWLENFALIRDMVTRKYPAFLVTYENVLDDSENVLPPILQWLGADDVEGGIAAVSPQTRTQDRARIERDHEFAELFDELYELVGSRSPVTNEFIGRLNDAHVELIPHIESEMAKVMADRHRRRKARRSAPDPLHPDVLEALVHGDADDVSNSSGY